MVDVFTRARARACDGRGVGTGIAGARKAVQEGGAASMRGENRYDTTRQGGMIARCGACADVDEQRASAGADKAALAC